MTNPLFQLPLTITNAAGPHITVTYTTGSENLTFADSTLWPADGSGSTYLLEALETLLNTDANGTTWTVQDASTGLTHRTAITSTGGTYTPTKLTFLTTELTSVDLGLSASVGAPDEVNLSSGDVTGTYQRRFIWAPRAPCLANIPERRDWTVASPGRTSSAGVLHHYGSVTERMIACMYIEPALVYEEWTEDSTFASRVSGLDTSDPNAAFDNFWADYLALVNTAGTPTSMRFSEDEATPGTYNTVRLLEPGLLTMDRLLVVGNPGPLLYHFGTTEAPIRFREV